MIKTANILEEVDIALLKAELHIALLDPHDITIVVDFYEKH